MVVQSGSGTICSFIWQTRAPASFIGHQPTWPSSFSQDDDHAHLTSHHHPILMVILLLLTCYETWSLSISDDDDCADLITIAVFDKALVIEIDSKVMLNDLFSNSNHGTQWVLPMLYSSCFWKKWQRPFQIIISTQCFWPSANQQYMISTWMGPPHSSWFIKIVTVWVTFNTNDW